MKYHILDNQVKNLLEWLNRKKEDVMRPWLKRYWPKYITPNMLTSSRIFVGAVLLWPLALWQGFEYNHLILGLLVFAALTDLIDGPVARALNQKSDFGSLLDKVADKTLVMPLGTIEFLAIDPALLVVSASGMCVVIYTGVSKYLSPKHHTPPENIFGKFATALYFLAIILALWPPAWEEARIAGWMGFTLGCVSALYNFRQQYNIQT